ncbi:hypothetical protein [Rubellimicrobium aerolatum]|uniref:Uncharacterized protein n=1 Tax=Rubellimicrobium aerolatum TaxID=490979 RepID=A0ABW0SCP7_9RHOB|nr:hypothetical protein [Rubellimicrobium aerolatum]MBP1806612.1 hypothetical protein [Rubellimicrobium aerolatum]
MGDWVNGAVIAALIVAVGIYPWQKHVEHLFILRKEKRDLFRQLQGQLHNVVRVIRKGQLADSEEMDKIRSVFGEISLICSHDFEMKVAKFIGQLLEQDRQVRKNLDDMELRKAAISKVWDIRVELLRSMKQEMDDTVSWNPVAVLRNYGRKLRSSI